MGIWKIYDIIYVLITQSNSSSLEFNIIDIGTYSLYYRKYCAWILKRSCYILGGLHKLRSLLSRLMPLANHFKSFVFLIRP